MSKNPFKGLSEDLSCVDQALKHNDITHLERLFVDAKLDLPVSDQMHDFLLKNGDDGTFYQPERLKTFLTSHQWSVFTLNNDLQLGIKVLHPQEIWQCLALITKQEIKRCFEQVFDDKGELRAWLKGYFLSGQLESLYQQFGQCAVNFQILSAFATQYKQLLSALIPSDRACAKTIQCLFDAQMCANNRLIVVINQYERQALLLDQDFKIKPIAVKLAVALRAFFFQNKLIPDEKMILCIENAKQVLLDPHDISAIEKTKLYASAVDAKSDSNATKIIAGIALALVGVCLLGVAIVSVATGYGAAVSVSLLASSVGFFAGAGMEFNKGLSKPLHGKIKGFTNQAEQMKQDYQTAIAQVLS